MYSGQLAFVIYEIAAGKPVERKLKEAILFAAFSVLLVFGASTIVGDLGKLSDPVPVFQRVTPSPSQIESTNIPSFPTR